MTFVRVKLRPCILFFSRGINIYVSNLGTETEKLVSTNIHSNSSGIHIPVRRLISNFVKTYRAENLEELCYEHDFTTEEERLRKRAVSTIQTIFGLKPRTAQSMVSKCPALKSISLRNARRSVEYFRDKGVPLESIKTNPWLLTYEIETIASKIKILNQLNLGDLNAILPLLQLTLCHLENNSKTEDNESDIISRGNRIKYTCEKLQCSLAVVCKVFGQHEFLYHIPFDKYCYIMNKLLGAGISPSHILRDVWVFQYGIKNIDTKLTILKEVGVKPIKPWMLRSSPKIFETTLERVLSKREVLGENSIVEYLKQQLECDKETIDFLITKYPLLLRKHVPKLKELFDFLYAEGFTPQQVIQVPRILFHSVETIKSRLTVLREAGSNPTSLMTLCKSKRDFTKVVQIALKRKLRTLPDT